MLMQILSLTQDQINALPPAERATVQQLVCFSDLSSLGNRLASYARS